MRTKDFIKKSAPYVIASLVSLTINLSVSKLTKNYYDNLKEQKSVIEKIIDNSEQDSNKFYIPKSKSDNPHHYILN